MKLVAHRGASKEAPENTLAAFQLAWNLDADGVELDVRLTADGRVVVIHDDTTLRTTGVNRSVASSAWLDLAVLDAGSWKKATFAGTHVPLLSDVLEQLPVGSIVMVEIKCGQEVVPALRRLLEKRAPEEILFLCFDLAILAAAKKAYPHHGAYLNVETPRLLEMRTAKWCEGLARKLKGARLDGVSFGDWPGLNRELIERFRGAGHKVAVWTVDDPRRARELRDAGVDILMTNDPRRVRP